MKHLFNKAKDFVQNPDNKEVVAIATGAAIGVVIVPLAIKATAFTAGKIVVGTALGAATGYAAYKAVSDDALRSRVQQAINNAKNR